MTIRSRHTRIAALALTALIAPCAFAQTAAPEAAAPEAATSITGYMNVLSNYQFRGLSQSWGGPAIQGGFDYVHKDGWYAGLFGSNTSSDLYPGANMEVDVYGGWRGSLAAIDPLLNIDAGLIAYTYPGGNYKKAYTGGADQSFTTVEAQAALTYRWLTLKYSRALTDFSGFNQTSFAPTFTGSSKGSDYIEANLAIEVADKTTASLHLGRQTFKGQHAGMNYNDFKIGLARTFGDKDAWNASLAYAGVSDNQFWKNYGSGARPSIRDIGKPTLIAQFGRTF
jgi:uncharacterized protein (TIGR02001 family)